jgi:hypothetical protein
MKCTHEWSRAIRGRRTGHWVRTCLVCWTSQVSDERPVDVVRLRATGASVELEPTLDIHGRLERFSRPQVAGAVRQAMYDARQRQTGDHE